ncbi:S8 family peptidase [Lactiplantibacillus plantarum]|uniref:S8 family peptidase n=1 Tax=Lactiplantibacillus plantarum TaxID=1590 RepID=UPI002FE68D1D
MGTSDFKDRNHKVGRIDIVKGSKENIEKIIQIIQNPITKTIKKEMGRIDGIGVPKPIISLKEEERLDEVSYFELSFYNVEDTDALAKRLSKLLNCHLKSTDFRRIYGVLYLGINISIGNVKKLTGFNALRAANAFNNRNSFDTSQEIKINKRMYTKPIKSLPTVGMIDGGVVLEHNEFFHDVVTEKYQVSCAASQEAQEHGTSVASIILYGNIDTSIDMPITPELRIESVRGLPSEENEVFDLVSLENIISDSIPNLRSIKIWNLSVGPRGMLLDGDISSITALLDILAYKYDVLFVIAAGNTGNENGIMSRLQIPADSVNNIAVSAYGYLEGKKISASYDSIGPGREGNKMKPDLVDYGGYGGSDYLEAVGSYGYNSNECVGTSFSAPLVTRKLGLLMWKYPSLSVLDVRALVAHYAALNFSVKERNIFYDGKGELNDDYNDLVTASSNEVRIMYIGKLKPTEYQILDMPIPSIINGKTLEITWTIAVKTPVHPENPDAYTEFAIEDAFYPDSDKYKFYKNDDFHEEKTQNIKDSEKVQTLTEHGFKRSSYPQKNNNNYYVSDVPDGLYDDEEALRKKKLKWDTVKSQSVNKRETSLNKPFIRLHALSRNGKNDFVNYTMVLSIRVKNDVDLYDNVLNDYQQLLPISVRTTTQTRI